MSNSSELPANFSTLIISLASSAVMALGLEKNPTTKVLEKDLPLARFNIDMLVMLKGKTNNNLNGEERQFLDTVIADLQTKFVSISQGKE